MFLRVRLRMMPTSCQSVSLIISHIDTKGFCVVSLIASHSSDHIVAAFTVFTCGREYNILQIQRAASFNVYILQHITKRAAVCLQPHNTDLIRISESFWCPLSLMSTFPPRYCLSFPASVPTRGLWLLQRVVPPVSPSFISLTLPFIVVPPVYDECHCLCPIQLI